MGRVFESPRRHHFPGKPRSLAQESALAEFSCPCDVKQPTRVPRAVAGQTTQDASLWGQYGGLWAYRCQRWQGKSPNEVPIFYGKLTSESLRLTTR
jgi:hypothetical protein